LKNNQDKSKQSNHGGSRKGAGRTKGAPNKFTSDVKNMILEALEGTGGVDYLIEQSQKNPTAFMTLVGKVLPMTVIGDPDAPLTLTITKTVHSARDTD
jgi:hypothetical protein